MLAVRLLADTVKLISDRLLASGARRESDANNNEAPK